MFEKVYRGAEKPRKRSMFPRPRYHGGNGPVRYREHDVRVVAGALARLLDQGSMQREWRGAHPRPFRRSPWTCPRRPYLYGNQRPEGYRMRFPPKGRPWDWRPRTLPRRGPPVAAIRVPVGTNATNGRRGGLVGPSPDVLCGEAPKGQPMIRRPRPRQIVRRPMGEEPGRRARRRAPPSSPWTRAGKKERGAPSPEPLHGKQAATLRI